MILVTGATGNIGGALLSRLSQSGVPVRALVRSRERADTLRGFDVELALGTYEDQASLNRAVSGVDRVLLLSPPSVRMAERELAVVRALREHAPQAVVVKLAVAGVGGPSDAGPRLLGQHQQVVRGLTDAGLATTVLAPVLFMQNLLASAGAVQKLGRLQAPAGNVAISHVDARDVAAVAAHVLTSDGHEGATYTLTGPQALTYDQVAEVMTSVLGREVRYVPVPPEQVRELLVAAGTDPELAEGLLELRQTFQTGGGSGVTDEVEKATGRPARSLEQFLVEHRAAFA